MLHRDWIRTASNRLVLDPGIPDVRDWITSIVAEVVMHYPVDGVQFDDYFYAETADSPLNDSQTFRAWGQGFASKADWRRHNAQQLIEQVSRTIKQLKPQVEFGVSPAGVWRNLSHDAAGSDTRGAAAYDEAYADTRRWVQQGLYRSRRSSTGLSPPQAARYNVLAHWWANVVKPTHNAALYRRRALEGRRAVAHRAGLDSTGRRAGIAKADRPERVHAGHRRHYSVSVLGKLP
nr:liprotein, glycosyl hydrolase-like protein [Candidatus Pantoea persica]